MFTVVHKCLQWYIIDVLIHNAIYQTEASVFYKFNYAWNLQSENMIWICEKEHDKCLSFIIGFTIENPKCSYFWKRKAFNQRNWKLILFFKGPFIYKVACPIHSWCPFQLCRIMNEWDIIVFRTEHNWFWFSLLN